MPIGGGHPARVRDHVVRLAAAWLGFGLAWTLVGVLLLARPEPTAPPSPRFA